MRVQEYPRADKVNDDSVLLIDGTTSGTQSIEMNKIVKHVNENIEHPDPPEPFDLGTLKEVPQAAVTNKAKLLIKPIVDDQSAITIENFMKGIKPDIYNNAGLTGVPTAPTAEETDISQKIANTEFVKTQINNLINGAPETLDTLKEIADAIGENADAIDALNSLAASKVPKSDFESYKLEVQNNLTQMSENCDINSMAEVEELKSNDRMIVGVYEENEEGVGKYTNKSMLVDLLKKEFGSGGGSISPIDSVVQVPFIYGYSILVRDYEVTLPSGKNSVTFGSLDDLGITLDDMVDLSVLCITDNSTFDCTINNNSFQIISGSGGNWGTTKTVSVRVCITIKDDQVDLPYIYGYKMITKEVYVTIVKSTTRYILANVSDFDVNKEDVVEINFMAKNVSPGFWSCSTSLQADGSINLELGGSPISGGDYTGNLSLIVRDETKTPASALDISSLETVNTIEGTDKFLINTGEKDARENKAITALDFMNNMAGYLPKGVKCITKKFEVTNPAKSSMWKICNLSDFGIDDVSKIVNFSVITNPNFDIWFGFGYTEKCIYAYRYAAALSYDITYIVTLFIKDYSEIGSKIVTENVKMITKEITAASTLNASLVPFGNVSDFEVDKSDVIAVMQTQIGGTLLSLGGVFIDDQGNIYGTARPSFSGVTTGIFNVSLFVRVPVVEELPRFTKDIEVTSTSGRCTLLTLDGSENCGGYTMDNFHSINVFPLTDAFGLDCVYLMNGNVITGLNRGTASGTVLHHRFRIMIE